MNDGKADNSSIREYEVEVSDADWNELNNAISNAVTDAERHRVFCQWLHDKAAQARAEIEAAPEVGCTYTQ